MTLQEDLQELEFRAVQVWELLTGKPSLPSQLERLYLKPLVYLVSFFVTARAAIAATSPPGKMVGSIDVYRERVLAISPDIADAGFTTAVGNNITIHLLAKTGEPSTALLNLVLTTMQLDQNRQICDTISILPAMSVNYSINAGLILSKSANEATTLAEVTALLNEYTAQKTTTLGADIIRSDIINIIRDVKTVLDVNLTQPATNITIPPQSYAVGSYAITVTGRM